MGHQKGSKTKEKHNIDKKEIAEIVIWKTISLNDPLLLKAPYIFWQVPINLYTI